MSPAFRRLNSSARQARDSSATTRSRKPYKFPEEFTIFDAPEPIPPLWFIIVLSDVPFSRRTNVFRSLGVIRSERGSSASCWPNAANMRTSVVSKSEHKP